MQYTLTQGNQSNLQVDVMCTQADLDTYKQQALHYFQKDMDIKGFRKGHVPLAMVEEQINPQYLLMAIYGEAVDRSLKQIIAEQPEYRLIGEPYDLHQEPKDDTLMITYKIDLYPQAIVQSDNRQSIKPQIVDLAVTEEELTKSIEQLCREHAEYQNVPVSDVNSIIRLRFSYLDENGAQIDQGVGFRGPDDAAEHPGLQETFVGLQVWDTRQIPYSQTDFPKFFLSTKKDLPIQTLHMEVTMISQQVIPQFNEENIKKRFSDASSLDQVTQEMKTQLQHYKSDQAYIQAIDAYISEVIKDIEVALPKTILDAEIKSRKETMTKRFGGEIQYQKYMDQMTEEQKQEMNNSIATSAQESLTKYFVMDVVLKHHNIDINDYKNDSGSKLEQTLYDKLMK